jgi:hypothetical protein
MVKMGKKATHDGKRKKYEKRKRKLAASALVVGAGILATETGYVGALPVPAPTCSCVQIHVPFPDQG